MRTHSRQHTHTHTHADALPLLLRVRSLLTAPGVVSTCSSDSALPDSCCFAILALCIFSVCSEAVYRFCKAGCCGDACVRLWDAIASHKVPVVSGVHAHDREICAHRRLSCVALCGRRSKRRSSNTHIAFCRCFLMASRSTQHALSSALMTRYCGRVACAHRLRMLSWSANLECLAALAQQELGRMAARMPLWQGLSRHSHKYLGETL